MGYRSINEKRKRPLESPPGCLFICEFRDIIAIYGRKARSKSIPQIMKEIEYLTEPGADSINIVPLNQIVSPSESSR